MTEKNTENLDPFPATSTTSSTPPLQASYT